MPEMDGFDLLMKVRNDEMLCHIPFILLSVVDSVDSKIKGLEYGADVYIEKPFSLGYVKATGGEPASKTGNGPSTTSRRGPDSSTRKTIWAATTGSGWTS